MKAWLTTVLSTPRQTLPTINTLITRAATSWATISRRQRLAFSKLLTLRGRTRWIQIWWGIKGVRARLEPLPTTQPWWVATMLANPPKPATAQVIRALTTIIRATSRMAIYSLPHLQLRQPRRAEPNYHPLPATNYKRSHLRLRLKRPRTPSRPLAWVAITAARCTPRSSTALEGQVPCAAHSRKHNNKRL